MSRGEDVSAWCPLRCLARVSNVEDASSFGFEVWPAPPSGLAKEANSRTKTRERRGIGGELHRPQVTITDDTF